MTTTTRRIVVGTDGSRGASAAIDWAAAEAVRRHCPLVLAHAGQADVVALRSGVSAVPVPAAGPMPAYVDDSVERVRAEWPGLTVSSLHVAGHPSPALIAEGDDASMIVVGARGRSLVAEVLLGSVSRHVSAHARCPVVIVHEVRDRTSWPVAVGIDGSPTSAEALRRAADEAVLRGVTLLVVHAWRDEAYTGYGIYTTPVDITRELQQDAEYLTSTEVETIAADYPDLDVLMRVAQQHPVTALIQASHEAQLVVVGSHGRGFFPGMRQGAVTSGVVHGAACPVMVVPAPRS